MKKGSFMCFIGSSCFMLMLLKLFKNMYRDKRKEADKFNALYLLMNQWVNVKLDNKDVGKYMIEKGYGTVAIYGMSYAGETLLRELTSSGVDVKYGIDRNSRVGNEHIKIMSPDDDLLSVDAVIVTVVQGFEDIKEILSNKLRCPIMALDDILFEM